MAVDGQKFLTKTQHYRKVTKPLLERKRRARMNLYLDELKYLVVDFMEAEGEHVAKLEKADILEMTVNFLKMQQQHVGRHRSDGQQVCGGVGGGDDDVGVLHMEKFRAGYTQAAYDVSKLFATLPGLDIKFGTRLMQHLGCRLKDIKSNVPTNDIASTSVSTDSSTFHVHPRRTNKHTPQQKDINQFKIDEIPAKQEDVWRPW